MKQLIPTLTTCSILFSLPLVSCENLPGSRTQQSTAIGAAAGAAAGAVIAGEGNRVVGALIGAAVGGAGGYLLGAKTDWFEREDGDEQAVAAVEDARRSPATASDVERASTADLNDDGFVTFDEVVAMEQAGLSDSEILARLRATDQVFDLNADQRKALLEAGVSPVVVAEMPRINQAERNRVLASEQPLGRPR
jgi:Glycine zipper